MLDIIRKDCKSEDILIAVTKLNTHGIQLSTNFMIGLPDETEEDFQITLETIKKIINIQKQAKLNLYRFMPFPGTHLYSTLVQRGELKEPKNLDKWGSTFLDIDSGVKPWLSKNDKIGRPVKSFYLWLGFIRPNIKVFFRRLGFVPPSINRFFSLLFKVFGVIARYRLQNNLFFFPLEWWSFKKLHRVKKTFRDLYAGARIKKMEEY
jgi:radical SAM superfamily enzyme YgiQ (UPF0313 family)